MKNSNLSRTIKCLTSINKRQIATVCLGGILVMGLSACNEETATEETIVSAETAAKINPTDLAQKQTVDTSHGPYGYRQPGYVNQDAYITGNELGIENLAYYGDWDTDEVYIIDVDSMEMTEPFYITVKTGDGPYGIDQQGPNKAYALTRRIESLTAVDNYSLTNDGSIELQHKPRSTNFNANTLLSLVSGGDKAMTSIIRTDMDKVTKVVGKNVPTTPHDFGGSLSTGHPLWVSDHHFFMIDRAERQIQLWNRDGHMLSVLETPTSIHHIFQPPLSTMAFEEKNVFYAVIEGNQTEGVSPGIIRFSIIHNSLKQTARVNLHDYDSVKPDDDDLVIATMGSHHADFHPDGVYIYMGSAEGHVFVIDKNKMGKDEMAIVAMVDAGEGAGHTTFLPMHDKAIITNHNAKYMTVIDTVNHKFLRNIDVAKTASSEYKSQAHTSGVSLDMKYFYSAASHDGIFFRIDLVDNVENWEVTKTLEITGSNDKPSNLLMGSFVWNGEGVNM